MPLPTTTSSPPRVTAEKEKDRNYGERVRQVEHASFTPLIFATTGGVGKLTTSFLKRLASRLADKRDMPYSVTS